MKSKNNLAHSLNENVTAVPQRFSKIYTIFESSQVTEQSSRGECENLWALWELNPTLWTLCWWCWIQLLYSLYRHYYITSMSVRHLCTGFNTNNTSLWTRHSIDQISFLSPPFSWTPILIICRSMIFMTEILLTVT